MQYVGAVPSSLLCKEEWHVVTLFHIQAARFSKNHFRTGRIEPHPSLTNLPLVKTKIPIFHPLKMDGRKMDNFLVNIGFKGSIPTSYFLDENSGINPDIYQ